MADPACEWRVEEGEDDDAETAEVGLQMVRSIWY